MGLTIAEAATVFMLTHLKFELLQTTRRQFLCLNSFIEEQFGMVWGFLYEHFFVLLFSVSMKCRRIALVLVRFDCSFSMTLKADLLSRAFLLTCWMDIKCNQESPSDVQEKRERETIDCENSWELLHKCLIALSKYRLVRKYHTVKPEIFQSKHLPLNPRQSSEIGHSDCWHTCPGLEMLEAVGQSTGGCPQSPIWWQAPAAAQGNWHLCPFVLEVAVKVTRASVSLSWNALSWELVIWQKFQNQKNTSTPNNSEIKPGEGGRKGGYFMLWKLFSFRPALPEGDKWLHGTCGPTACPLPGPATASSSLSSTWLLPSKDSRVLQTNTKRVWAHLS